MWLQLFSSVTTHELLQSTYTSQQDFLLTPTGMNLALVEKLLQHKELCSPLEGVWSNGHRALTTIHQIQNRSITWWEMENITGGIVFGWSPTATGIPDLTLHPVIILLTSVILCLMYCSVLYAGVFILARQAALSHRCPCIHNIVLSYSTVLKTTVFC